MIDLRARIELANLKREHLRLSALLAAVLLHTGPVKLSKEEAEAVYDDPRLRFDTCPDGGMVLYIETPDA